MNGFQQQLHKDNTLMYRLSRIAITAIIALIVAACQTPGQTISKVIFPTSTPRPTPRPEIKVTVCDLISLEEAQSVVGTPLQYIELLNENNLGSKNKCYFMSANTNNTLSINIRLDQPYRSMDQKSAEMIYTIKHQVDKKISDFANLAYISSIVSTEDIDPYQSIYILQGDAEVTVTISGTMSERQREESLKEILQIILSRLPSAATTPAVQTPLSTP